MDNAGYAEIKRTMIKKCSALGIPVSGVFELTPRCNLQCRMCYIRMTESEMKPFGKEKTAAEWIALAKSAVAEGMLFLLVTGGEPLLRPDFPQIYEELMKLGLSVSINTNGTLIDEKITELWKRFPPAHVNVTLYGTSEEDYEALCGDKTAYARVVEAVDRLLSEGIVVKLNVTMTPQNAEKLRELEEFASSRNISLRMNPYCFPPLRRNKCDAGFERLSASEAGKLTALDIYYREGIQGISRRLGFVDLPVGKTCEAVEGEGFRCPAGRAQFWVCWNGVMSPCGMLTEPCADPFEVGFSSAWKNVRDAVKSIKLCADCANCKEKATCMTCAAVMVGETGSFTGRPQYVCEMNAAYREAVRGIASEI